MELTTLLYFLIASVLLTLAPGPDIMYLLAKSLADGTKAGISLALGLTTGLIFHTTLVIIGVAAIIQQSPLAFATLKYIGAAYLLYLAWGAFHAQGNLKLNAVNNSTSFFKLYINLISSCLPFLYGFSSKFLTLRPNLIFFSIILLLFMLSTLSLFMWSKLRFSSQLLVSNHSNSRTLSFFIKTVIISRVLRLLFAVFSYFSYFS